MQVNENSSKFKSKSISIYGLIFGPLLAILVYFVLPSAVYDDSGKLISGLTKEGQATAAIVTLMAIWWITEAIPLAATALLPIVLFPLTGASTIKVATAPYANKVIFLFMGGFMLGLAMQRWNLHRRFALKIIQIVGSSPTRLVGGFMIATGFLSMWVSNTATVIMMLPIGVSVIDQVLGSCKSDSQNKLNKNFPICLLLSIAYSASIGGIATLIGTPPNAYMAAFINQQYGQTITFLSWMKISLPFVLIFGPIVWWLLTRVIYPVSSTDKSNDNNLMSESLLKLGPMKQAEWSVLLVATLMALSWIFRPLIVSYTGLSIDDSVIAIAGALLLFIIPAGRTNSGKRLLNWEWAVKLPWGVLILFGGGLSIASAMSNNGVAQYFGNQLAAFGEIELILLIFATTTTVIFLTEITSNTATTATFLPILAALAISLNVHPYLLIMPMTIAASSAFMLPVATPPNAIIFSSGHLTIKQMCKAGIIFNIIGIVLITLLIYFLAGSLLGINLSEMPEWVK